MARQFKPVRFFVMMAVAAFVVCGVTAFYTHRAAHSRTVGGAGGVCNWHEGGRGGASGGKVADRR